MLDKELGRLLRQALEGGAQESQEERDAACARRLYLLGVHDALTDAIRTCEFQIEKHEQAATFCAEARSFLDAGVHKAKASEANLLSMTLREALKKATP